jgi:competence protein ComEC
VLIEGPNGNQVLYDAGSPDGMVLRRLSSSMMFFDHSIDTIILSHPDLDHTGGFPEILRRYHVDLALEPGVFSGNGAYEVVEKEIEKAQVKRVLAREGMTIDLGDGARIEILYPSGDVDMLDTNDASVVARVSYGDTSFLLSGDLPSEFEEQVVARYGTLLHAQVVKLGHHGSRTSSSPLWLAAVHPEVAIISRGIDNRYGHPHKETIDRLHELTIPYLDTSQEGDISFESNGEEVKRIK